MHSRQAFPTLERQELSTASPHGKFTVISDHLCDLTLHDCFWWRLNSPEISTFKILLSSTVLEWILAVGNLALGILNKQLLWCIYKEVHWDSKNVPDYLIQFLIKYPLTDSCSSILLSNPIQISPEYLITQQAECFSVDHSSHWLLFWLRWPMQRNVPTGTATWDRF